MYKVCPCYSWWWSSFTAYQFCTAKTFLCGINLQLLKMAWERSTISLPYKVKDMSMHGYFCLVVLVFNHIHTGCVQWVVVLVISVIVSAYSLPSLLSRAFSIFVLEHDFFFFFSSDSVMLSLKNRPSHSDSLGSELHILNLYICILRWSLSYFACTCFTS